MDITYSHHFTTMRHINSIKNSVRSILGISRTSQIKELFPEFDLRYRDSWQTIESYLQRPERSDEPTLEELFYQADAIMDKPLYCMQVIPLKAAMTTMALDWTDGDNNVVPFSRKK